MRAPQADVSQRLFSALNRLLTQQLFSKITVQMIADEAGVHRNTFYLHFNDKFDLLSQFLDQKLSTHRLDPIAIQQHPFTTIANSYAATMDKKFIKQSSDSEFIQSSTDAFCRAIIRVSDSKTAYQVLGQISAILIWLKYRQKPLNVFQDYQKLDAIYASKSFPE